ncbi:MAG TPA: hypothetical protein VLH56_17235 [Dissulfurispiraceae bacterium]|nr:hypothetical protein [Dissulfurispiraceae bacterium]
MTFQEIYEAVMLAIGDAQYSRATEVKAVCNMIYLNEICQCDDLYPLFWLMECDDSRTSKPPVTITGITKATPPVVAAAAHGMVTGDLVTLYDVAGMTECNNRIFHFTKLTVDTGSLQDLSKAAIPGAGFTAYTSGGRMVHRGTLINDCAKVLMANWHGYNKGLEFIGPEEIEDDAAWMDKSTSRPTRMMHRQVYTLDGDQYDYLLWYQGADAAYSMRLWYEKQVAALENEDDVPLLPAKFHSAIIAGAVMRLGVNAVQVEAGVIWPTIYKMSIDAIRTANRRWWETQKPYERSGPFLI